MLGEKVLLGYDIGCVFEGTVSRTSLASLFKSKGWWACVNAMHGYTHEFLCRLTFHPSGIHGMGLEDLETMERLFSAMNALAAGTRHMSEYRRRVFIDLFLQQWDCEKYQNLGNFLLNNYRQALKILDDNTLEVNHVLSERGLTGKDIVAYIEDEKEYFHLLGCESEHDVIAIAYVEALQKFAACS